MTLPYIAVASVIWFVVWVAVLAYLKLSQRSCKQAWKDWLVMFTGGPAAWVIGTLAIMWFFIKAYCKPHDLADKIREWYWS